MINISHRRVCEAVSYAHAKGVVHLDLVDNVLVGYLGDVQVTDWGLSRARRGKEDMFELEKVDIDEDTEFIIDSKKKKLSVRQLLWRRRAGDRKS